MSEHIDELKEALSLSLLRSPYDPNAYTPESSLIRKIADIVSAYDVGDVSSLELHTVLKNNPIPGWDWDNWLAERVNDGTYGEEILNPEPDD